MKRKQQQGTPGFYFMRAGATEAHARGLVCGGGSDLGLSDEGKEQIRRATTRAFAKNPQKIKTIFSSTLLRSMQSADFAHDMLHVKMRALPHFSERHFGQWEGKPVASAPGLSEAPAIIPGGESLDAFEHRVSEGLSKVLDLAHPALLVGHLMVGQVLQKLLNVGACVAFAHGDVYRFSKPLERWECAPYTQA
ncbi:MAG: histidine phosphatase family protein [Bacteriovoracia bacterium]